MGGDGGDGGPPMREVKRRQTEVDVTPLKAKSITHHIGFFTIRNRKNSRQKGPKKHKPHIYITS